MKSHFDRIGHTVSLEVARRSCLDKVRYESRSVARDKAAHIAKYKPHFSPLRPYKCTICGKFHLTSSTPIAGGQILSKRSMP